MTAAPRVVLGVAGGIAAYKACSLLRLLTESGHDVTVVPTEAALHFVGAPTWAALSGKPVATDVWSDVHQVPHVRLGREADLVVVAPATADLLARAAHGLADDLLTNVLLTARCPVVLAPAMHTEMWQHAATVANVATLRGRGVTVVEPVSGRLTGADTGPGRLPEPADLYAACLAALASAPATGARLGGQGPDEPCSGPGALSGRRVVVSAGGTREALDPVRFLGNRSSGKQGYALAQVAAARGADVVLVAANVGLPTPARTTLVSVESASELQEAVTAAAVGADVVVMAAAVADFRPARYAETKIKKRHGVDGAADDSAPVIELVRNPDILAGLVRDRDRGRDRDDDGGHGRGQARGPVIVGFAAETGDDSGSVLELAAKKLDRKGCDVLVANEVGRGLVFGQDDTLLHVLRRTADGGLNVTDIGPTTKVAAAASVWDVIQDVLAARLRSEATDV